MKIKSPLVESKFGTEFPSFMISTWFTKIVFFFSVNGKSIAAGAAAYIIFSKFTSRCGRHYSFCFLRIGVRAKGEPPERAKKRLLCSVRWRFGRAACDKDSMLIFTKNNVRAKIAIVIYCTEMINLGNGNEHVLNYEQAKSAWKNKGKIKFLDLK